MKYLKLGNILGKIIAQFYSIILANNLIDFKYILSLHELEIKKWKEIELFAKIMRK